MEVVKSKEDRFVHNMGYFIGIILIVLAGLFIIMIIVMGISRMTDFAGGTCFSGLMIGIISALGPLLALAGIIINVTALATGSKKKKKRAMFGLIASIVFILVCIISWVLLAVIIETL